MPCIQTTTIGTRTGLLLDDDILSRLNIKPGDFLHLTQAPDGGYRITPHRDDFARQIALAETIMRDDHAILHALAK